MTRLDQEWPTEFKRNIMKLYSGYSAASIMKEDICIVVLSILRLFCVKFRYKCDKIVPIFPRKRLRKKM